MSLTKASYSMITGAPVNVMDYGAVCDGVTDDTAAIQAAIDAAPTSKAIYFPGLCLTSAPLTFAHNSLVKLYGTGTSGITNNTSNLFTVDCGLTLLVEDLQLVSGASGGHIINLLSPRAGASYSGLSQSTFTNVTARVSNTTKSVIHMGGTNSIYIDNLWLNFNIFNTASHAAHTFNFVGGGGSVGANKWLRGRITYGTIHAFRFECTATASYLYDNTLESINFEVLNGGAVKGIGVNGLVVRDCFIYDVNLTGTINDHVIYLDKVSGGQPSRAVKIENFYRRSSLLNTGIYDIYCASGGVNLMVIDLVALATVSGFKIQLNSAANVTVLGFTSSTVIDNPSATTTFISGGSVAVGTPPTGAANIESYVGLRSTTSDWTAVPFTAGTYRLWVDATGDLRIKNGAPTSDTDGTVVGTQT